MKSQRDKIVKAMTVVVGQRSFFLPETHGFPAPIAPLANAGPVFLAVKPFPFKRL